MLSGVEAQFDLSPQVHFCTRFPLPSASFGSETCCHLVSQCEPWEDLSPEALHDEVLRVQNTVFAQVAHKQTRS